MRRRDDIRGQIDRAIDDYGEARTREWRDYYRREASEWATILLAMDSRSPVAIDVTQP